MSQPTTLVGFQLSPQQKHVWLARQEGPALVARCAAWLEGKLDPARLQKALQGVAGRHEVLRTTFQRRAGMRLPLQVIRDDLTPAWQIADRRGVAEAERPSAAAEAFESAGRVRIDLENGPVVHATLSVFADDVAFLVVAVPVVCADAESLKTLVRELASLYGEESGRDLNEQPLQYADFSEWQNEVLSADDEDSKAARKFWADFESASLPAVTLADQSKETRAAPLEPASVPVRVSVETFRKLSKDGSIHHVLLGAWEALVSRLAGQPEVSVAVVLNGRSQAETRGAMGLFAKAVPVRAQVEDQSLRQAAAGGARAVEEASRWQDYYPFESDAEASKGAPARIGFDFVELPDAIAAAGLTFRLDRLVCPVSRFALALSATAAGKGGEVSLRYDPRLFDRRQAERFAAYLARLLEAAAARPDAPLADADLLDEAERRHLLIELNQTAGDFPRSQCIHFLFEEQAARTPDRPALRCGQTQLTYGELNAHANRLAHHLRRLGVGPNVRVGLCGERSADLFVGLLAVLKAGGAYVPLLPDHPKARLAFQIQETGAPVVLTQQRVLGQLPDFSGPTLCLDRDRATWGNEPATNPERVNGPENQVYVIYTSGSTGVPKGVAVRHENLVNYTHYICRRLGLDGAGLNFATVSTPGADLGNTCIFPSLVSGGCLHVIDYDTSMDAGLFARAVADWPIDVLKITPSHLSALLGAPEGRAVLPRKFLILGGEASSWELVKKIRKEGSCAIINHYGPTETTVGSLTYDVPGVGEAVPATTVPIGRPIANTQVYVLDRNARPVPQGVPGELYIGGAGVAEGYLNQPEQTRERFLADPFSQTPGARLYRTGDRVRYLPDGNIEFLGRVDHQVKIRGFRVELPEIESALGRHPAVRQSAVIVADDQAAEKRLVGFVVPAAGGKVTADELRTFLGRELPDYMLPASLVVLDSLPLNANGKVDRMALSGLEHSSPSRPFLAPRNPVEEKLAAIWTEVLRVERVGVDDNFFELGGHSLLATQVISRIRTALQVQLPLRTIFETPTVGQLAGTIMDIQKDGAAGDGDMDQILAELEGLSEEEVQQILGMESGAESR